MYLDSSSIVAIIAGEPERDDLIQRLAVASRRATSVVTVFETILALARKTSDRENAPRQVQSFLRAADIDILPVDTTCMEFFLGVFQKYHRGSGHSGAKLNFGDCVTYAMAKTHNLKILYKGNDFAQTDMA